MNNLEEWEHHVIDEQFRNVNHSLCGVFVRPKDMPIQLAHAKRCIEQNTRLQPCPKCMKAV